MCNALNPILNLVGDVRDYLDSLAQVVALPLLLNHIVIHLPCGDVVLLGKADVQEPLVVPKIQIYFSTII